MMLKTKSGQTEQDSGKNTPVSTKEKSWQKLKNLNPKEKSLFIKLAICLVIGIALMMLNKGCTASSQPDAPAVVPEQLISSQYNDAGQLEQKLIEVLSAIKGAGTVLVALTYETGPESVYALESSEKTDDSRSESSSAPAEINSSPVLIKQNLPQIKGIVIVAEGAGDPLVQERLYRAAKSLLKLNHAQIAVLEGNSAHQ